MTLFLFALLLLHAALPERVFAAIAFDIGGTGSGTGTTINIVGPNVGAGADRVLLVGIAQGNSVAVLTSVTWDQGGTNQAMTRIASINRLADTRVELWRLVAPTSGAKTLRIVSPSSVGVAVGFVAYTGVDQTTPNGAPPAGTSGNPGTTPSITVSSAVNDVVVDAVATKENLTSKTAGAGQTQRAQRSAGDELIAMSEEAGGPSVVMTWSGSFEEWAQVAVSLKPAATTTIGNGTDPANATIAPGAAATMVDAFTLQTNAGTDTVTAATVTLAAGTSAGISLVEITSDSGATVYGSASNPGSDSVSITGMSLPVTTTLTQFKVRITPKSHAAMPAPAGSSYAVTARISAWTGTNTQAGSDTAGTTVTIDNLSPANVTGASATAGDAQVTLSWTNPGGDFSNVVVLRKTATITDVPDEGSSPALGSTIGTSVVQYISSGTGFTDTGLTNGTPYFYRIFAKDTNGNYAATGVEVSVTPCLVVANSAFLAATARNGQATVHWSSPNAALILRKAGTFAGEAPSNGQTYVAGNTIGAATVVDNDSVAKSSFTNTGLTNGTTYSYKAFPKAATACYAAGTDTVTARPVTAGNEAWSYMLAGGSALKPPTTGDSGTVYFSSNASRIISLSTGTGLHSWSPPATTQPVQGYLVWTSLSSGGAPLVFGGDQSGTVYAVDSTTGTTAAPGWQTTLTGADTVQAGVSVQIRAYSDFGGALPGTYDVVYAATSNTTGAFTTNNKVVALRSDTGAVVWTFNPCSPTCTQNADQITGQPWVDYYRNRLYVTSRAGSGGGQSSLWVLDSLTGSVVTSFALGHISTAPTQSYDGNTLWVGNENGDLNAIDLTPPTPALKWTAQLALGAAARIKGFVWEDYTTPERLYFSTNDGTVRCFQDPGVGGTPSPAAVCSGWGAASTAVAGAATPILLDQIYVGSWNGAIGRIQPIDPATGAAGTPFTVGDGTRQVGDVSTETGSEIFVGTTEGKIFKITLPLP